MMSAKSTTDHHPMMKGKEYRKHLEALGMTQRSVAKFLGISERSSGRYAIDASDIPKVIELLLRVMVETGMTPDKAYALTNYKPPKTGWGDARFSEEA